jgi:hypothetical protein
VFRAAIDGRPLTFFHTNMVNVNMTFADRETGTRWQQETGEAIEGPLKGRRLDIYPFMIATWKEWREQHPKTLVMEPVPGFEQMYEDMWNAIQARRPGRATPADGTARADPRLPGYEPIIGLEAGRARRAYPLEVLRKEQVVNDYLDGQPVLLIANPKTDTVTVFSRNLRGRTLSFQTRPQSGDIVDVETGSRWNAYGECVAGQLRGRRLDALVGRAQFWWSWAAFHAGTDIYTGRGVPPR